MQTLTCINIADTHNNALIKQCGFYSGGAALERGMQKRRGKRLAERVHTQMTKKPMAIESVRRRQIHETESPGIVVPDFRAIICREKDMIVRPGRCGFF